MSQGGRVGASATALSNCGGAFAEAQTPAPCTPTRDDTSPPTRARRDRVGRLFLSKCLGGDAPPFLQPIYTGSWQFQARNIESMHIDLICVEGYRPKHRTWPSTVVR